MIILY